MDRQNLQKLMAIIENGRTSTAILAPNNTMVVPNNLKRTSTAILAPNNLKRTSTAMLAPNNTMVVPNDLKHEQVASNELEDFLKHEQVASNELEDFPVEFEAQTVDYEEELEAFDTYVDATFDWTLNGQFDTFDDLQLGGEPQWPLQPDPPVDTFAPVVTTAKARKPETVDKSDPVRSSDKARKGVGRQTDQPSRISTASAKSNNDARKYVTQQLRSWMIQRVGTPYPLAKEMDVIARTLDITVRQVRTFCNNFRKRFTRVDAKMQSFTQHFVP
jgi:hypothetical protein